MIYKDFKGERLSALGFGLMRLPQKSADDSDIDTELTAKMLDYAMKHGVNYYDTAWGYHSGESENIVGKLLSAYPRDSYMLASKFPGYDLDNMPKVREIFEKQLKKCRTDHFDFYLFHNVCEINIDAYLDPEYGIYDYLIEQRNNGRIKHLGCSMHGELPVMKRFLDAYGRDMEFCQLQINWLDWGFQNAAAKVELVKSYGIPVWVMEPVRGGKLASLPAEYEAVLKKLRPHTETVEWAFRFLQSIPEVCVTLSGMSNYEQVVQNIEIFSEHKPLNVEELAALASISSAMTAKKILPCTACRYCTGKCPRGLDIPALIRLYNEHKYSDGGFLAPMAVSSMPEQKRPSACIGCRSCEKVCPQGIKISEMMKEFDGMLKGDISW